MFYVVTLSAGGTPKLAQPSHAVLRLGAIHKLSSVHFCSCVLLHCCCICPYICGMEHNTVSMNVPFQLICAEPDPVSGGTRLARYSSLWQQCT